MRDRRRVRKTLIRLTLSTYSMSDSTLLEKNLDLPVLKGFANSFKNNEALDLSKVLLICVQHLFLTTHSMFSFLFEFGLRPENLFVMGKCYSTRPETFRLMKEGGIEVSNFSNFYDSHLAFDDYFQNNLALEVESFLNKKSKKEFNRIILLDEGGNLLSLFNEKYINKYSFSGIEQTSSGFNKLNNKKINFPIINVARSNAKLNYETPLVIDLCINRLKNHIYKRESQIKDILILGNGVIGSCMKKNLDNRFNIKTIDNKYYSSIDDYQNKLISLLSTCDAIIGCTGDCSIPKYLHQYLKRPTFLISISSSDREFDAVALRKKIASQANCHEDLWIEGLCLVNSGFPYPFDGNYEEIDLQDFQLTRGLLLAGIFQACLEKDQGNGFIELNKKFQQDIIQRWIECKS